VTEGSIPALLGSCPNERGESYTEVILRLVEQEGSHAP
jgi:hypothetical protein